MASSNPDGLTTVVFGTQGQLTSCLKRELAKARYVGRHECDFQNLSAIGATLDRLQPRLVINPAAYTNVDGAEKEEALAMRLNGEAPGAIASWCQRNSASLIHLSTDYVYDGSGDHAWLENASTGPINVYGKSKLLGEQQILASRAHAFVLRTSWVFSAFGHNFVKTMIRLGQERETLKIVNDQRGTPTSAHDLARAIKQLCGHAEFKSHKGIYNLTQTGFTTWYDFTREIFSQWRALGVSLKVGEVSAISSNDFPTPAKRPKNSCLDCAKIKTDFGIVLRPWADALHETLVELALKRRDSH